MTVYELASKYKEKNPDGHFFDKATLKFFGERISEMRVLKNTKIIKDVSGKRHECYILTSLQRKCPTGPRRQYHYFDHETFKQIIV